MARLAFFFGLSGTPQKKLDSSAKVLKMPKLPRGVVGVSSSRQPREQFDGHAVRSGAVVEVIGNARGSA